MDDWCAYYVFIGVPPDEFWHGDYENLSIYRKAYELKRKQENQNLWLQGLYFYEALCDASPLFLSLAKQRKPIPYREEPYPMNELEKQEQEERKEKARREKAYADMMAFMDRVNKKKK